VNGVFEVGARSILARFGPRFYLKGVLRQLP